MEKVLVLTALALTLVVAPKLADELAKPALVVLADSEPLPVDGPADTRACTASSCPRPNNTTAKVGDEQTNPARVIVGDGSN
jgi:hypothetical protein